MPLLPDAEATNTRTIPLTVPQKPLNDDGTTAFLLREAGPEDTPHILQLARLLDSINLPTEEIDLHQLIARSQRSFRGGYGDYSEAVYVFVLEERTTQRIVGASMIIAKHGTPDAPHFYLEMATDQRYSKTLKKFFSHTYLTLRHSLDGPTEVGGLIVEPTYRQHPAKIGRQLSFVRFLYVAMYPERFEEEVLAEILPTMTATKESLFWECYGKRVTGLGFREADTLCLKDKEFIDALFPPVPIYICMLPVAVQEQIGKAGPDSQGAVRLLEKVGLRFLRHVDPFDGGPYYGAKVKDLLPVQQFRRYELATEAAYTADKACQDMLIGWESTAGFRAASIQARAEGAQLYCRVSTLEAFNLQAGMTVAAIPLM